MEPNIIDIFKEIFKFHYQFTTYSNETIKKMADEYLKKYDKCKKYLDKDFLEKLSKLLGEMKSQKETEKETEIDNIWQELNKINAFDSLKSTDTLKLINHFIYITCSITRNIKYFESYYKKDYMKYLTEQKEKFKQITSLDIERHTTMTLEELKQIFVDIDKHMILEKLKQITLIEFIILYNDNEFTKQFVGRELQNHIDYLINRLSNKLSYEVKNLINIELKEKIFEIMKNFYKFQDIIKEKMIPICQRINEIEVANFLLDKNYKLQENTKTKKNTAGPDFKINHQGKIINIEVVTLSPSTSEIKKDKNYFYYDDNFTERIDFDYDKLRSDKLKLQEEIDNILKKDKLENPKNIEKKCYEDNTNEPNIPNIEILMSKGIYLNRGTGYITITHPTDHKDTIITRLNGVIDSKRKQYNKWLVDKKIKDPDLNIILIYNNIHHLNIEFNSNNSLDDVLNPLLYGHDKYSEINKPSGKGKLELNLFSKDEFQIIHGIWLINVNVNVNNLFYNYKILEQNKDDWEILKNLKLELKQPLPEYIKQENDKINNVNIYYKNRQKEIFTEEQIKISDNTDKCLQLIKNLKYNSWYYFLYYVEIEDILQKDNPAIIKEIKTNNIKIENNINEIINNIKDKILFYLNKEEGLKLIYNLKKSLLNSTDYYNDTSYLKNKNNNLCLSLQSIINQIIELDKKILENYKTIIKNSKEIIYEFIRIIKNNNNYILKDSNLRKSINNIIFTFKNIKKDYKIILSLIEESSNYKYYYSNNNEIIKNLYNDGLYELKQSIYKLQQLRIKRIKRINDNTELFELFFINNEYFLPKSSYEDPKLTNFRKYYRKYMDKIENY